MQSINNFSSALAFTLSWEGKVEEDVPGDPGGKTKWGITQLDYNDYRKQHQLPAADVFQATEAELTAIYKAHYWTPINGDQLVYPVALVLFDTAVNVGLSRVLSWLRAELGIKPSDPWLFAQQNYVAKHGANQLAQVLISRRSAYYQSIGAEGKPLHKFLNGWLARDAALLKEVDNPS